MYVFTRRGYPYNRHPQDNERTRFIYCKRCHVKVPNKMEGVSLLDMVITTIGVLLTMALLTCLCCLCMKISDLRLKCYIIETAKKKGINVEIDKLDSKGSCTSNDDTCTIMVPEVCIITA